MKVEIISPDKQIYSGEATLVSLPGTKGSFEIEQNHAAIISTLEKGKIKIKNGDKEEFYEISSGLVECRKNQINILVN